MNVATILKAKGRAVATARPDATLLEISGKLAAKKIGAIIIVGDGGKVAGIISERDIIRALGEKGAMCLSQPVSDFMTKNVVSCREFEHARRSHGDHDAGPLPSLPGDRG